MNERWQPASRILGSRDRSVSYISGVAVVSCTIPYLYVPSQCPPLHLGCGAAHRWQSDPGLLRVWQNTPPAWLPARGTGKVLSLTFKVELQFFVCFAGLIEINYIDRVLQEFVIEAGEAARG